MTFWLEPGQETWGFWRETSRHASAVIFPSIYSWLHPCCMKGYPTPLCTKLNDSDIIVNHLTTYQYNLISAKLTSQMKKLIFLKYDNFNLQLFNSTFKYQNQKTLIKRHSLTLSFFLNCYLAVTLPTFSNNFSREQPH